MKRVTIIFAVLAALTALAFQGGPYFTTIFISSNIATDTPVAGENAFTTTAIRDTVLLTGALATDFYTLTPENDTSQTPLSYIAKAETLIVLRKAGGTSALGYAYARWRPK